MNPDVKTEIARHKRTAVRILKWQAKRRSLDGMIRAGIASLSDNPGLIRFKEWVAQEQARHGLSYDGIYSRWKAGQYPRLLLIRINQRVVFVVARREKTAERQSTAPVPS